jgi:hypothetical protein
LGSVFSEAIYDELNISHDEKANACAEATGIFVSYQMSFTAFI